MATTLPTHVSILTGTHPGEHGVLANVRHGGSRFVASPELRSFAQYASQLGMRTAAFVSGLPLKRGTGVERGFAVYDEPARRWRPAGTTTDRAIAWLESLPPDRAVFLWVHYFDPHSPYAPPPPYDRLFETDEALEQHLREGDFDATIRSREEPLPVARGINLYDGEIRYVDDQLGRLLAAFRRTGRWERTVAVVAGDHGEGLGQHGMAGHGQVWEEQLRAPLLMRVPGEPPRRIRRVVSSVDVLPTLLGAIELPDEERWLEQASGEDRLRKDGEGRPALSRTSLRRSAAGAPVAFALTEERWKYVREEGGEERLFDLARDPYELAPADASEELVRLRGILEAELERQRERASRLRPGEPTPPDPELLRELEALGYVDAGS